MWDKSTPQHKRNYSSPISNYHKQLSTITKGKTATLPPIWNYNFTPISIFPFSDFSLSFLCTVSCNLSLYFPLCPSYSFPFSYLFIYSFFTLFISSTYLAILFIYSIQPQQLGPQNKLKKMNNEKKPQQQRGRNIGKKKTTWAECEPRKTSFFGTNLSNGNTNNYNNCRN